jgi:hypothetical protein
LDKSEQGNDSISYLAFEVLGGLKRLAVVKRRGFLHDFAAKVDGKKYRHKWPVRHEWKRRREGENKNKKGTEQGNTPSLRIVAYLRCISGSRLALSVGMGVTRE